MLALNYFSFLKIRYWSQSPLADYFAKNALLGKAQIFGIKADGEIVSFAIVSETDKRLNLLYLETEPRHRRQGYATKLVQELQQTATKPLQLTLLPSEAAYPALVALVNAVGYKECQCSTVFEYTFNVTAIAKVYAPLEPVARRIVSRKRQCLSFKELSPELVDKLRLSEGHELKPTGFFDNPASDLAWDLSYALINKGEIEAYALLSRPKPNHIVYELFSTLTSKKHSGLIVAPFYYSYLAIKEHYYPLINKVSFLVFDDNNDAMSTFKHFIKHISYTEKANYVYTL